MPRKIYAVDIVGNLEFRDTAPSGFDLRTELAQDFLDYSDKRWVQDCPGWKSSLIPNARAIFRRDKSTIIELRGKVGYRELIGNVKRVLDAGAKPESKISAISTEVMPITTDGFTVMLQRNPRSTQHGPGLYNFPSKQNAEMYLEDAKKAGAKDITDIEGFINFILINELGLEPSLVRKSPRAITSFSKGMELSFDCQFNAVLFLPVFLDELMKQLTFGKLPESVKNQAGNLRFIPATSEGLVELLSYTGSVTPPKDVYGNYFGVNSQTGQFGLIDDTIGLLFRYLGAANRERLTNLLKDRDYDLVKITPTEERLPLESLV